VKNKDLTDAVTCAAHAEYWLEVFMKTGTRVRAKLLDLDTILRPGDRVWVKSSTINEPMEIGKITWKVKGEIETVDVEFNPIIPTLEEIYERLGLVERWV